MPFRRSEQLFDSRNDMPHRPRLLVLDVVYEFLFRNVKDEMNGDY